MNPPKYTAIEYINFLIATQKVYSCSEAERVQPTAEDAPAHDAIKRLLHCLEPSAEELWQEAKAFIEARQGILEGVIDFCGTQSESGIGVVNAIAGASLKLLLGANLTQSS